MLLTYEAIARRIDHALLAPAMTEREIVAGCHLAARYEVATVCIKPYAVPIGVEVLQGTGVGVGTVIGFPHGGQSTECKVQETNEAMERGATEIDMVINIGAALSDRWDLVETEIRRITETVHERAGLIKVIFETCYLDDLRKIELCRISGRCGVDFVKTSTGFGSNGATEQDIALMRRESPSRVRVKASGNIKDLAAAITFSELGADRLGLSRTADVLDAICVRLGLEPRNVSRGTEPMSSGRSGPGEY